MFYSFDRYFKHSGEIMDKEKLQQRIAELLSGIGAIHNQGSFLRLLLVLLKLRKIKEKPYQWAVTKVLMELLNVLPRQVPKWKGDSIEICQKIALDIFSTLSDMEIKEVKGVIENLLPEREKIRTFVKHTIRTKVKDAWNNLDEEMTDEKRIFEAANEACAMDQLDAFKFFNRLNNSVHSFYEIMKKYLEAEKFERVEENDRCIIGRKGNRCIIITATISQGYVYVGIDTLFIPPQR